VRVVFGNVSAILSAAVEDGMIARNPCKSASVRPPGPDRRRVVPWTANRVASVREALDARYRAMVDAGSGLGMRQGEVFGLAVDDADFLRRVVHVRRQVKIVGGKLVFAPPKGGKERDVPLPSTVALRFSAHIAECAPVTVSLPWRKPDGAQVSARLIFTSPTGLAVNRNSFSRGPCKDALKKAGVPQVRENGFHALRHYFASVLLHDGVNIRALAEYLGHSDPGFTLRIYTHLVPAAEDRMREAVDRAFSVPVDKMMTQTAVD
jgi:integrase